MKDTTTIVGAIKGVLGGEVSPVAHSFTIKKDILCPIRNDVHLAFDWVMSDSKGLFPVIPERMSYNRSNACNQFKEDYARHGYAVVVQDVRGRLNSDEEFNLFYKEHKRGDCKVEWIAAQRCCNGNVGMTGTSCTGETYYEFARFDRKLQTGAENWLHNKGEPVVATQRMFHDDEHPSHVILPIIPAGSARYANT